MQASPQDNLPAKGATSRLWLYGPFVLLAIFIVIWSAVWAFGARQVGQVLDGFIAREASRGRDWVCPERSITGFPFRLQLTCAKPQLIERGPNGMQREASLAALSLHGRITSPGHYIALLESPMTFRLDPDRDVTLRWQSARGSFRAGAAGIAELSVEILRPEAMLGIGEARDERISAKDFAVHFRRSPGDAPGSDLLLKIGEISHPALDRAIGNPDPLTLEMQATAPGLLLDPSRRIEEVLEAWRLANGQARIVLAKASKGPAALDLSGVLGLDGQRRLAGNLQGRARGVDQVLGGVTRRMGLEIGNLLGRMGGGQGMPVALTFENGRMRFGPLQLMRLEPLY
ncbi:MAG: DUF2125 domain-containing protein [Rhizobiales bacterium]|nr:DUF2125 domain-containing protein [Hyphomicrobiales bacterium]